MAMKLFNSKSMSTSDIVLVGRICSNPVLNFKHSVGTRFSPKFCYCKGVVLKASYSSISDNAYLSNEATRDKLAAKTCLPWVNGTIGASSNLCSTELRILDAVDDEYGGVLVNPEKLPTNPDAFAYILRSSLSCWKMTGKKGIWLKLPRERSELVPTAVKEGFEYHHAERGYVMLTYWIPDGPCMLPANASHQVGVGGFVVNEKNEVLVVQEKHCDPQLLGLWKIPTGFINESEEIFTGAVREVEEETGVETEFVEIIAFRHVHNVAFEKSDLFFICMLKPLSSQITVDNLEIEDAKWMPLVEFVKQPLVQEDCMFKKVMDICIARLGKHYCGLSTHHVISKFDGKSSSLYYNVVDKPNSNCICN